MSSAPQASSAAALARMKTARRRDTKPEMAIRSLLHARGLRYRVDVPPIEGMRSRADIVFAREKVAVFVDGCFWHLCPDHGTLPKANAEWWRAKLERNQARDEVTTASLSSGGWVVIRCWEHDAPSLAANRIERAVLSRR